MCRGTTSDGIAVGVWIKTAAAAADDGDNNDDDDGTVTPACITEQLSG